MRRAGRQAGSLSEHDEEKLVQGWGAVQVEKVILDDDGESAGQNRAYSVAL